MKKKEDIINWVKQNKVKIGVTAATASCITVGIILHHISKNDDLIESVSESIVNKMLNIDNIEGVSVASFSDETVHISTAINDMTNIDATVSQMTDILKEVKPTLNNETLEILMITSNN